MKDNLLALAGAVVGGVVGYLAVGWLAGQHFYGMVLPGGLVGIGAGFSKNRTIFVAIACGILALGFGIFAEWRHFFPALSFGSFIADFKDEQPITWIMIAVGTVIGFWFPYRRLEKTPPGACQNEQNPTQSNP
jgi:hypothetical protein